MTKPPTLKQLASGIMRPVIERFRDKATDVIDHQFRKDAIRMKVHNWNELVGHITPEQITEAETSGAWIDVDGIEYLPGDIRIVKEYRNSAASESMVDQYDDNKTKHIPFDRLFTPSLFPKLDYKEVRERWLVLGDNERVQVGDATPEQWVRHDRIEAANFTAQEKARKKYLENEKRRKKLFASNRGCSTTDQLMKKLGAW